MTLKFDGWSPWKTIGHLFFLSHVTLKFDGWPWKTIANFLYATSSFVHLFVGIHEFKLKLVWKHSIQVKISNFLSLVNLKFDGWPWKRTKHLFYATSSFVHHFVDIGAFKLELQSGNAQFGPKLTMFFVPCNLEIWLMTLKNNRHLFYTTLSFVHRFKAIGDSNWSCSPETPILGQNRWYLLWPWNLMDDLEKQ